MTSLRNSYLEAILISKVFSGFLFACFINNNAVSHIEFSFLLGFNVSLFPLSITNSVAISFNNKHGTVVLTNNEHDRDKDPWILKSGDFCSSIINSVKMNYGATSLNHN